MKKYFRFNKMFYLFLAALYIVDLLNGIKEWFSSAKLRNIAIDILSCMQTFMDLLWKWVGAHIDGVNKTIIVNKEVLVKAHTTPIEKIYTFSIKEVGAPAAVAV